MKILFLFLMLTFVTLSLHANLVLNEPFTYTQPDGTKLNVFVSGDEFYHRVHDKQGYTILQQPSTGIAVYAMPDGKSIKASNYRVGQVDPSTLGIQPNLVKIDEHSQSRSSVQQCFPNRTRASTTGTMNNICIFLRFSDQTEYDHLTPFSDFDKVFNLTDNISVRDYFKEISSNQLTINSTFYPAPDSSGFVISLIDSHPRNYYLKYSTSNPIGYNGLTDLDTRKKNLITDAVNAARSMIPISLNIDNDYDNNVDAITIIIRGIPDNWNNLLWPQSVHSPTLLTTVNGKNCYGAIITFQTRANVSTSSHELSHVLGAPDLYHYDPYEPWHSIHPAAGWDLMDLDAAQHWTTYLKRKYGHWFTYVPEIYPTSTPTTYYLTAIDTSPYSCYKIATSIPDQYYILEFRRRSGLYESNVPLSGMIIYRIDENDASGNPIIKGNEEGPPDELYVYRPGGTINTNGYPDIANFSLESGRTVFNNFTASKPWLYTNTTSMIDGNLVISDVGTANESTISFTISNVQPNEWLGTVSRNWFLPANWSNGVPNNTQDILIAQKTYNPLIDNAMAAECRSINITGTTTTLSVDNGSLHVFGNLSSTGTVMLVNNNAVVTVDGNTTWMDGGQFQCGNSFQSARLSIGGSWLSTGGSTINSSGIVEFTGWNNAFYVDKSTSITSFRTLRINKTAPGYVSFNSDNTVDLNVEILEVTNGWMYYYSTHKINIGDQFNCTGGHYSFGAGSIHFVRSGIHKIIDNSGYNSFYDVSMEDASYARLDSDITINHDFILQNGTFNANGKTIRLNGAWVDSTGTVFVHQNGRVIFSGSSIQTLGNGTFGTLEVDKSFQYLNITGAVTCQSYDWTAGRVQVEGGSFAAVDLADNGIDGDWLLQSGSIDLTQDSTQFVDLRGTIVINSGTMTIHGGMGTAYIPYQNSAMLYMTNGVLDFANVGIYINSMFPLNLNITGGTIRTAGWLSIARSDFQPSGGIMEMYGSANAYLDVQSGSWLNSLIINKGSRSAGEPHFVDTRQRDGRMKRMERSQTVSISNSPLTLKDSFTLIAGTVNLPMEVYVGGDWINFAGSNAVNEGTGTVTFNGTGYQYINHDEHFYRMVISKASGALRISDGAVVDCQFFNFPSGTLDMLLGTFTATDLDQDGIYGNYNVNPDCIVNLHQDTSSYTDLNANLYINGGEFHVYGGYSYSYISYSRDTSITMDSGLIDFHDCGLIISSNSFTFSEAITGGTLRTTGGFLSYRNNFHPEGGSVELYGTGNVDIYLATGSSFSSLNINKSSSRLSVRRSLHPAYTTERPAPRNDRSEGAYISSNTNITGDLTVLAGILNIGGRTVDVTGNTVIAGSLKMVDSGSNDNLNVHGNFEWVTTATANITNGNFDVYGNYTFYSGTTIALPASCSTEFRGVNGSSINLNGTDCSFGSLSFCAAAGDRVNNISSGSTDSLRVLGSLQVSDGNTLNLNGRRTRVQSYVQISANASLSLGTSGYLLDKGSLSHSGTINVGNSTMWIKGSPGNMIGSSLIVNGGTFRTDYSGIAPTITLSGAVTMASGLIQFTSSGMTLNNDAKNITGGTLRCMGNFSAQASNMVHQTSGGVDISGIGTTSISCDNGNYIGTLWLNKESGTTLNVMTNLDIRGSVSISSGILNAQGYSMTVGGHWQNSVGTTGFVSGSNTITFNSAVNEQTVSGRTTFYNINASTSGANFLTFSSPVTISGTLHVNNLARSNAELTISGTLELNTALAQFHALSGANIDIAHFDGGGYIYVSGGTMIAQDLVDSSVYGNYYVSAGSLSLIQDTTHDIDINGGIYLSGGIMSISGGALDTYVSYGGDATINMTNGILRFPDHGVIISSSGGHSFNSAISGGTIQINGSFLNYRSNFSPIGGTVEFIGDRNANILQTGSSRFWDMSVNKSSSKGVKPIEVQQVFRNEGYQVPTTRSTGVSLTSDVKLGGSMIIKNGQLTPGLYSLHIDGNWADTVSSGGFVAGTSTVYFEGNSNGSILTNETFSTIIVNKADSTNRALYIAPSTTVTLNNDLYIQHGILVMQNMCSLTCNGYFHIASGAGLDPNANTLTVNGNWNDENAFYSSNQGFSPKTSLVKASGNAYTTFSTACPYLNFYDLTIDKGTGQLTTNNPVYVTGNIIVRSGSWGDGTGSTSYSYGHFSTSGTANLLWNTSNTMVFAGRKAQSITYGSSLGQLRNVTINKPVSILPESSQTVTLAGDVNFFGDSGLNIMAGELLTNHHILQVDGSVIVNGGAQLSLDSSSILKIGSDKALTVYEGGVLSSIGTAANQAIITSYSGYYDCNIESGATISAEYTTFEQLKTDGVNIKNGATVNSAHPLSHCTFQNGISSGTLLTINNAQTLTIPYAVFPTNSWSGAYNVKKSSNQGTVNFTSPSGAFAGPNHESDAYNRVNWEGFVPDLQYVRYSISNSNPNAGDSVRVFITIRNNSNVDITNLFYIDFYKNPSGTPTSGQTGDTRIAVYSLGHGDSTIVSCNFNSSVGATWHIFAQADGANSITETNETNNLSPQISITWQSVTPPSIPSNITISVDTESGEVILNWDASTGNPTGYHIYRSNDPEFDPERTVLISTNTALDTTFTDEGIAGIGNFFYRVTAYK